MADVEVNVAATKSPTLFRVILVLLLLGGLFELLAIEVHLREIAQAVFLLADSVQQANPGPAHPVYK